MLPAKIFGAAIRAQKPSRRIALTLALRVVPIALAIALAGPVCAAPTDPGYDPAAIGRIGITYARYRIDLARAFSPAPSDLAEPSRADLRRLGYRFSNAVDDAVRERIAGTMGGEDPARAAELQKRFANDQLLDQATQAIRVFGLRETDLGDVASALVIAGYNASHAVALTAAQGSGVAVQMRRAMLASPVVLALDDATKQTIATEMQYQILFWESDTSTYRYVHDRATYGALITSIVGSLKTLGIPLASLRPTDDGLALVSK